MPFHKVFYKTNAFKANFRPKKYAMKCLKFYDILYQRIYSTASLHCILFHVLSCGFMLSYGNFIAAEWIMMRWVIIRFQANYCIYPKYLDRQAIANGVDPDQMPKNAASESASTLFAFHQQFSDRSEVEKWTCSNFRTKIVRS